MKRPSWLLTADPRTSPSKFRMSSSVLQVPRRQAWKDPSTAHSLLSHLGFRIWTRIFQRTKAQGRFQGQRIRGHLVISKRITTGVQAKKKRYSPALLWGSSKHQQLPNVLWWGHPRPRIGATKTLCFPKRSPQTTSSFHSLVRVRGFGKGITSQGTHSKGRHDYLHKLERTIPKNCPVISWWHGGLDACEIFSHVVQSSS